MIKNLLLCTIVFICSCKEQTKQAKNDESINYIDSVPKLQLAIPIYSIELFFADSLKPTLGFGYNILVDGQVFVHQPTIPSIPGNNFFPSKEKANAVAELMIYKLKNNIMPPSISQKELDSLKILTN